MRPWVTDYAATPDGDHEVQVTYPDGKVAWITIPVEVAGAVDPIDLAEAAERRPPPALARGRSQPTG